MEPMERRRKGGGKELGEKRDRKREKETDGKD
jgi:hypothetical protein